MQASSLLTLLSFALVTAGQTKQGCSHLSRSLVNNSNWRNSQTPKFILLVFKELPCSEGPRRCPVSHYNYSSCGSIMGSQVGSIRETIKF